MPMSLAMARVQTISNLRPELNPQLSKDGYLVLGEDGTADWYTHEEFNEGVFIDVNKGGK